ncbi:MAG: PEP-CTERM sorting domain-containing protein, partial [Patescibacteria group bacterium]|nr:PEP-CTERM sorting domain-containing protein [Patescibacteria group bacterium]
WAGGRVGRWQGGQVAGWAGGSRFQYLTTDPALPAGNLSFNGITFRSDTGALDMSYTYGTLLAVPEPSSLVLLVVAGMGCALRRRRRAA